MFAIVDGLEDYRLPAPSFILRWAQRMFCAPEVARRATRPHPSPKVSADMAADGVEDFAVGVPAYGELG